MLKLVLNTNQLILHFEIYYVPVHSQEQIIYGYFVCVAWSSLTCKTDK